jgi:hypothetical protein
MKRELSVTKKTRIGETNLNTSFNMKSKSVAAGMEGGNHEVAESENGRPLALVPTPEEIRQRAYELHIERGYLHGWDQDDWLQAEQELKENYGAG